jgi:hypothetical protein
MSMSSPSHRPTYTCFPESHATQRLGRSSLEMTDAIRYARPAFSERSQRWINGQHQKVLQAITRCRSAALGGHHNRCSDYGHTAISYNSCLMVSNSL